MALNDKIRKLMALATHPGSNAQEAAAAAAMAAELALKYNIDLESVSQETTKQAKVFMRGNTAFKVSPRDRSAGFAIQHGIAKLYGVKPAYHYDGSQNHMWYIGQEHNVAVANSWSEYLWNACLKANVEYSRRRIYDSAKERYRADQTFRLTFSREVCSRLEEKQQRMKDTGVSSTGTALVVVNWYEAERKEIQAWVDNTMKMKTTTSKAKRIDSGAALAGHEAGRRVGLHDQLAGRAQPTMRRIA
jgi:hypothetical protein